jgi:hypothetical protein
MARNFSKAVHFDKMTAFAVVVPQLRKDGMYYEINIKGYHRFFMKWSELGRYDITEPDSSIPYSLVLAVSDILDQQRK